MINERSIAAVDASKFGSHFRKPLYESYCFSRIPVSLPWLLTGEGSPALPADVYGPIQPPFDHVVFCFIDAFGWQHVERALAKSRFLQHAVKHGVLSKMTSMFPSTTAAHVTTINTGQTPNQSGVYAWQYHEPILGTIFEALPFSFVGQTREGLKVTGVNPLDIYPGPSIYSKLAELGVRSFTRQPSEITGSTCNQVYMAGAEARPFRSLAAALVELRNHLLGAKGPTYTMLYWDRIDSLAHAYGADSEAVAAEVEMVWLAFEKVLHDHLAPAKRTLLLISADHGHMRYGPDPVLLTRDYPDVVAVMEKDRVGRPLAPAGSRRDFFLHIQHEHIEGVCQRLREGLAGTAEVYPTAELIAAGFFGEGPPSERFLARVGNVTILPYAGQSVWWQAEGAGPFPKVSSHGGLTPEETEIPLFVLPYD